MQEVVIYHVVASEARPSSKGNEVRTFGA